MTSASALAPSPSRTHTRITFLVLSAAVASYTLLQSLVIPVLPTIQQGLHTSQSNITWVLTAYLLAASVFTPIMGRLGDMYGKERLMLITLGALGAGSVLAALAGSLSVMIVARVVQGIGGGVIPLAFGIVRDEFPKEKISGAIGSIASLTAAGAGLGIVLAGPIVNTLDYHWLFWIPAGLMLLTAVATWKWVPESPVRSPGKLNYVGAVLLSGWLVALLVPVSEAPVWGWGSGRVVGLLALAAVLLVLWVVSESRSATPIVDMRMMRLPAVWTSNLVALLFGVGLYATFAFLPEFLQTPRSAGYGFGASITQSGLVLLPSSVVMFTIGQFTGRFSARWGAKAVLVAGATTSIATFALLALAHTAVWLVLVAMVIQGLGFGLAFASMSNLVVAAVPAHQTGVASGMNANIRTIGGSIGAAVMSSVVTAHLSSSGLPLESGYTHGFLLLTGATVLAALAALLVPATLRTVAPSPDTDPHAGLALVAAGTLAGDLPE